MTRPHDPDGDILRLRLTRAHQEAAELAKRAAYLAEQAEQYALAAVLSRAAAEAAGIAQRLQDELAAHESRRSR